MAWQLRGCPLNFSVTVDPAAFEIALGDAGEQYDATSSKKGGKKLRMVKMDGDSVVNAFGKVGDGGLCGRAKPRNTTKLCEKL